MSRRIIYLDYILVQMIFVANGVVEYTIHLKHAPQDLHNPHTCHVYINGCSYSYFAVNFLT